MAFHWRADDGPLIVVFGSSLYQLKEKKSCQTPTPSDKTSWIRAWVAQGLCWLEVNLKIGSSLNTLCKQNLVWKNLKNITEKIDPWKLLLKDFIHILWPSTCFVYTQASYSHGILILTVNHYSNVNRLPGHLSVVYVCKSLIWSQQTTYGIETSKI